MEATALVAMFGVFDESSPQIDFESEEASSQGWVGGKLIITPLSHV